jgi:hypothetical protein
VLRNVHDTPFRLRAITDGYDSSPIHVAMLNDRTRVSRFLDGIREVVQPGDVVLDLGTGAGIFAIAAAQAGARHVYALEASAIGDLAEMAFAANDLADRITLIRGWSTQIALPERCDVLISEMVGNEPTADYMMEIMMDARKRLLKPQARMVPGRVRIFGLPLTIPVEQLARYTFTEATAQRWSALYGMDLRSLGEVPRRNPQAPDGFYISVRPYTAREWPTFSEPVLLADIDMTDVRQLQIDTAMNVTATASGVINGLLVFFETQLGPTTRLSIAPSQAEHDSFRYTPVWVLNAPVPVEIGQQFRLEYRYRVQGARGGVSLTSLPELGRTAEAVLAGIGDEQ